MEGALSGESRGALNLAGYKFVRMTKERLNEVRILVKELCKINNLKGTVYLAQEGINSFLAGREEDVRTFIQGVKRIPEFESGLEFKESWSKEVPFDKLQVRRKKEVIAMGVEVDASAQGEKEELPSNVVAPKATQYLSPQEFAQWLDEGKDMTVLDTRNSYEWRVGAIENSVLLDIYTFRDFPDALQNTFKGEELEKAKNKPLVMYCTGGIRCEKAGPYLEDHLGFREVYQLHGGILKYFEEIGGKHYKGDCYVFDKRLGVKPDLTPSDSLGQCATCRSPLTPEDKLSPLYKENDSCPYCQVPYQTIPFVANAGG